MEQFQRFLAEMYPVIRRNFEDQFTNTFDLNTAVYNEIYRLWENEEREHLPKVYGVKLNDSQLNAMGALEYDDRVERVSRFLESSHAPHMIHVDSDDDNYIYLTVDEVHCGEILRDWIRYKLNGRTTVRWHIIKETEG